MFTLQSTASLVLMEGRLAAPPPPPAAVLCVDDAYCSHAIWDVWGPVSAPSGDEGAEELQTHLRLGRLPLLLLHVERVSPQSEYLHCNLSFVRRGRRSLRYYVERNWGRDGRVCWYLMFYIKGERMFGWTHDESWRPPRFHWKTQWICFLTDET